eukprot:m51a1_g1282 putative dynein heavy chain axonemal (4140) ;mRNA; f:131088-144324
MDPKMVIDGVLSPGVRGAPAVEMLETPATRLYMHSTMPQATHAASPMRLGKGYTTTKPPKKKREEDSKAATMAAPASIGPPMAAMTELRDTAAVVSLPPLSMTVSRTGSTGNLGAVPSTAGGVPMEVPGAQVLQLSPAVVSALESAPRRPSSGSRVQTPPGGKLGPIEKEVPEAKRARKAKDVVGTAGNVSGAQTSGAPAPAQMQQSRLSGLVDGDPSDPFTFIRAVKAKQVQETSFVYMTYRDNSSYNPYALAVVPYSGVNPQDYFTMSPSGVTHFCGGAAEFTQLDQWEHECLLYSSLMQIPMFKMFKMWKSYTTWRRNHRANAMAVAAKSLGERSFLLHAKIRPALLRVRELALSLERLRLSKTKDEMTFSMDEFRHAQQDEQVAFMDKVNKTYRELRDVILNACDDTLRTTGVESQELDLTGMGESTQTLHYAELAKRRTECQRLTSFIRLADYLLATAMQNVVISTVKDLLGKLTTLQTKYPEPLILHRASSQTDALLMEISDENKKKMAPMFRIDVELCTNELGFLPNEDNFLTTLDSIIFGFNDTVTSVQKLVMNEDFKTYTQTILEEQFEHYGPLPNGLFSSSIINEDKMYQSTLLAIREVVSEAFTAARKFTVIFHPLLEIFIVNEQTDVFKQPEEELTLDFFRMAIKKYEDQEKAIGQMQTMTQVGLLLVDSQKLKDTFLPSPQRCLADIHRCIPQLAHKKNVSLLEQINMAIRALTVDPRTVEQFVDHLNSLQDANSRQEEFAMKFKLSMDFNVMMSEYKVKIPEEEYAMFQTISPAYSQLKDATSSAEMNKDSKVDKFIQELDKNISKLKTSILEVRYHAQHTMISSLDSTPDEVIEYINKQMSRIEKLQQQAQSYSKYQEIFKVPITKYEELEETAEDLNLKRLLWTSMLEWNEAVDSWNEKPFEEINAEEVSTRVTSFQKTVLKVERGLGSTIVVHKLKSNVNEFKNILPLVMDLRNSALKPRHWERIQDAIQTRVIRDKNFTLGNLLALKVIDYKEQIANISLEATKEALLEQMLQKVENLWAGTEFTIMPHKESFIIGTIDDLITQLMDTRITIATIHASRFVGPIKHEVETWDKQLQLVADTLDEWMKCQRNWMYLESIFSASDMQRSLNAEYKVFLTVDKSWKDVMRTTKEDPNVIRATTVPGLLKIYRQSNLAMAKIHKALEEYLEQKRLLFPRFYFLSNSELLEILSQSRNVNAVQQNIRKCFDNIFRLEFTPEAKSVDIVAMISAEGERVMLASPTSAALKARGAVEVWLGSVEAAMKFTLAKILKGAVAEYNKMEREQWVLEYPAQIVLAVSQVYWCREVTRCLNMPDPVAALNKFHARQIKQLNKLVELVRGKLTELQRGMLASLITIDVHARDITTALIEDKVDSPTNFSWLKVLRYYFRDVEGCEVQMSNATFQYAYEYLGCTPRLVATPLTDRCYLTLTSALLLKFGGAPAGPAGTGKTETVKDLAKALAKHCVVFNCSDALEITTLSMIFSGQAQAGTWCCLDEFNRINVEVLSVVAQQLQLIQKAMRAEAAKFVFNGTEIKLNPTCGFFVTMNPTYSGRTELPDNLKSLFRPVAMMIPDYALIAEIMLFSEGFTAAKELSQKLVQLYKLSSEQLSQQTHYDFGMRAIKSVLFTTNDIPLFEGILSDLFPGVVLEETDYGKLEEGIKADLVANGLQPVDIMVKKVIQFYDTILVRHGIMVIGQTGSGKTTCYQTMARTMTSLAKVIPVNGKFYDRTQYEILNPKCVSRDELFGVVNQITKEWHDGLVGCIVRACVRDSEADNLKFIVFDGPVDSLWIENLNTVLDDNKMLCLSNGERIKLGPSIRMVFEVDDLSQASPATVSRCGMVFMQPSELGWRPIVKSWLGRLGKAKGVTFGENFMEHLWKLFDDFVDPGINFVRKNCKEQIPSTDLNLATSLANLFFAMFTKEKGVKFDEPEDELQHTADLVFVFSYVWSIGGNIDSTFYDAFDAFVRDQFEKLLPLPGTKLLYDYFIDVGERTFKLWSDSVPKFVYKKETPFFQMIVPTSDTFRFNYLLDTLICAGFPVLLTGETGVGKSVVVQEMLARLQERHPKEPQAPPVNKGGTMSKEDLIAGQGVSYTPFTVTFTARTSSAGVQTIIEDKLEQKRPNVLGAGLGKQIVLFIDDTNMPRLDDWGHQATIELLRQWIDYGGFYDRKSLTWTTVQDVTMIGACGPPGGGRNAMSARFVRHFSLLSLPPPNEVTLKHIFVSITSNFLLDFVPEIRALDKPIVNASVEMYMRVCKELLPIPSKSHYTFNLRDLSKVFQGILQVRPTVVEPPAIMRLWMHECMRTFHDRLVCAEDRLFFTKLLIELLQRHFEVQLDHDAIFCDSDHPLMFGDFLKMGVSASDRMYEEITDIKKVSRLLETYLDTYNMEANAREMNLVFFPEAVEHLARIARILRAPRGNALLIGVSGVGKRSLTRLGASMCEYKVVELEISKSYGVTEFHDDLKKFYHVSGIQGKPLVFLLNEQQIVMEDFLEDVNNMLNSGEVPGLYDPDEYEKVISEAGVPARKAGVADNRDAIYNYFIERSRQNLHIVLCMSPVGDKLRTRCRMFPSLVNCCTIDWFEEWPRESLLTVARHFLNAGITAADGTPAGNTTGSTELDEKIAQLCIEVHLSATESAHKYQQELSRKYYLTPASFLTLINQFKAILNVRREKIEVHLNTLRTGLSKLESANKNVDLMKADLSALQPLLTRKALATEQLLKLVRTDQESADALKRVVQEEELVLKEHATKCEALAFEAKAELDKAQPELDAAMKSLNTLNPRDIFEIRTMAKPPELVCTTMEAVLILLGTKGDINWAAAKLVLQDSGFLGRLFKFNREEIPEDVIKRLKKYIDNPLFVPAAVAKHCVAAMSLCMWVRAIYRFSQVFKEVEPKRQKLQEAEHSLTDARALLSEKQAKLAQVEAQLEELRKKYEDSLSEKTKLANEIQVTSTRIKRASQLTTGLADERGLWTEKLAALDGQMLNLVGDAFLSVACVCYLGPFTYEYRQDLVRTWVKRCQEFKVQTSAEYSVINSMATPVQIRDWTVWGLPFDQHSIENGIFATQGAKWPLLIDPQGQANTWIKNMEKEKGLKVVRPTDPNYMRAIENAIRLGSPILLEEVGEDIDPLLEPVLMKQITRNGARMVIRIGNVDVDYDNNFRLYLTTKLSNPHYLPSVFISTSIINATVTPKGLEDQLLALVVVREQPEMETKRLGLITQLAADKKAVQDLEDRILRLLNQTDEKTMLDDEILIDTLRDSKVTSNQIKTRVREAEGTEAKINAMRESYRPIAIRGSALYFVLADLSSIDRMYQFSLTYFSSLFENCILTSPPSDRLEQRISTLLKNITKAVYNNVGRGLFEQHKLIFSALMAVQISRVQNKTVSDVEWNLFMRGPTDLGGGGGGEKEGASSVPGQVADFLSETAWKSLKALEMIQAFEGLTASVTENADAWKKYSEAADIHKQPPPNPWHLKLSTFQKLMLIKILREERLVPALTDFVESSLGREFVDPISVDLSLVFHDINKVTPLVFILSQGADPTFLLRQYAEETGRSDKLQILSLGQGQGEVAAEAINQARKTGAWIWLQNCHLAASWMPELEKIVMNLRLTEAEVNNDFRLILSSMPSLTFPVSVLQNSLKITNEPPKGLKANLLRSLSLAVPQATWDIPMGEKERAWHKLLFGILFLHGIIQERKKYGAIGWNIKYEFNDSDLQFSKQVLHMFLTEQNKVPWAALQYMIGEISYGGRVTDDWDRRCLQAVLARCVGPALLDDGYSFSESGTYVAPDAAAALRDVRKMVEGFPIDDSPEVFGLHNGADKTYQRQEASRVMSTILQTQPRVVISSSGKTNDDVVLQLAEELFKGTPTQLKPDDAHHSLFIKDDKGRVNSLTTVLLQEVDRFNRLLATVAGSLTKLQQAIKGLAVMSEQLERMYGSLLDNVVPAMWEQVAYPSVKPLNAWFKDLQLRVQFIGSWLTNGQPNVFWFSGLFFPQGFVTGMLQNHARKYNVPINTLAINTIVVDTGTPGPNGMSKPPEDGMYIYGLFIDGAEWDFENHRLMDSTRGDAPVQFPIIHMQPYQQGQEQQASEHVYTCPIYKTSIRAGVLSTTGHSTNFVLPAKIPADKPPQHWILRGAALLCSLDH